MKALITGITGNLGYEVALDLERRNIALMPCIRAGKADFLSSYPTRFTEIVEFDLTTGEELTFSGAVDCIVHCAGVVHLRDAQDQNERMMRQIVQLAKRLNVPVHFASTAFVYKPPGAQGAFNNAYEQDKFRAEEILTKSGIHHSILRPAVLTGNSKNGEIRNFSGYYLIVKALLSAVRAATAQGRVLRFPSMPGTSNMVPVDQVAESIGRVVEQSLSGVFYLTNPLPPQSDWILGETLDFFNARDHFSLIDMPFKEFGALDLTDEEAGLYKYGTHFSPYWGMQYNFPSSVLTKNMIDREYLQKSLTYFQSSELGHV